MNDGNYLWCGRFCQDWCGGLNLARFSSKDAGCAVVVAPKGFGEGKEIRIAELAGNFFDQ